MEIISSTSVKPRLSFFIRAPLVQTVVTGGRHQGYTAAAPVRSHTDGCAIITGDTAVQLASAINDITKLHTCPCGTVKRETERLGLADGSRVPAVHIKRTTDIAPTEFLRRLFSTTLVQRAIQSIAFLV